MGKVWLKWIDGGIVVKAAHSDIEGAKAQAASEAKTFLGVYDGEGDDAKKIADVKGRND